MDKYTIARRVRERREYLWRQNGQYTQDYVATKLGITRPTYTRWESGQYSITAEDLTRLAAILGVGVAYFYGSDTPSESPRSGPESPGAGEEAGERDDVPPEVIAFYNDDALSLEAKERMTALLKALWQEEQRILRERQAHEPPPEGKG